MSLRKNLNVLRKTQKSTKHFLFQFQQETAKIGKNSNESVVTIIYKIKFIDNARSMASSLPNLVDNLAQGINKIKCKDCDCFLDYESIKNNSIKYKCISGNKVFSNKIDEELKKQFKNTFKFSNNDINEFIMLLRKMFILMSLWMKRRSLMIHYCLEKKNFIAI